MITFSLRLLGISLRPHPPPSFDGSNRGWAPRYWCRQLRVGTGQSHNVAPPPPPCRWDGRGTTPSLVLVAGVIGDDGMGGLPASPLSPSSRRTGRGGPHRSRAHRHHRRCRRCTDWDGTKRRRTYAATHRRHRVCLRVRRRDRRALLRHRTTLSWVCVAPRRRNRPGGPGTPHSPIGQS